ncbi:hypothetical protein ACH5RR_002997 [Cinchona calisaya]|uniref:Uncharacterized protein n=1 Tax=Cinchona calisaya TaxID=153742 RepID=A0ABD3ATL5_9GENT
MFHYHENKQKWRKAPRYAFTGQQKVSLSIRSLKATSPRGKKIQRLHKGKKIWFSEKRNFIVGALMGESTRNSNFTIRVMAPNKSSGPKRYLKIKIAKPLNSKDAKIAKFLTFNDKYHTVSLDGLNIVKVLTF